MREFNTDPSTNYDLKAQRDEVLNVADSSDSTSKASSERRNLAKPKQEQPDKALHGYVSEHSEGVSGHSLVSKANDFKEQMVITDECAFLMADLINLNLGMGFESWMFLKSRILLIRMLLVNIVKHLDKLLRTTILLLTKLKCRTVLEIRSNLNIR
jgi:hypothetical protein